jgi:hypothetical protein
MSQEDKPKPKPPYEPPKLIELGSVHATTQSHGQKNHGHADGFTFGSHHITNTSP